MPPTRPLAPPGLTLAIVLAAGCALGPSMPRPPRPVVARERIPHPSTTGSVVAHRLVVPSGAGADQRWFSLTELTDRQICVDFGIREASPDAAASGRGYLAARTQAERGPYPMVFRGAAGEVAAALRAADGPRHLGTEAGSRPVGRTVATGRMARVCVEDLLDAYGRTVGCRRYEDQPQTRAVTEQVATTLHVSVGGLRWCAANAGLVPADADLLEFSVDNVRYQLELTGGRGVARPGAWGGAGGVPALPLPSSRRAPPPLVRE